MSMSNFYTEAKRPQGTEFEPVEMMDNYYGSHRYGVRFPDGEVYPEDKCEFMTEEPQPNCKHIHDSEELNPTCHKCGKLMRDDEKSPLDGLIDDRKKGIYEIIGSAVSIPEYLEESIRLAVQNHADAVQNAVSFKSNAGKEFDLKFNKLICEEIQSASDKWRGAN